VRAFTGEPLGPGVVDGLVDPSGAVGREHPGVGVVPRAPGGVGSSLALKCHLLSCTRETCSSSSDVPVQAASSWSHQTGRPVRLHGTRLDALLRLTAIVDVVPRIVPPRRWRGSEPASQQAIRPEGGQLTRRVAKARVAGSNPVVRSKSTFHRALRCQDHRFVTAGAPVR
jgi:hypothetical protein